VYTGNLNLDKVRRETSIAQAQAAEDIGCNAKTISRIENGASRPSPLNRRAILQAAAKWLQEVK